MTRLADLRKRLRRLRRRRARVRLGTGLSAFLLAVLWVPAAAFAVDWSLEPGQLPRAVLLAGCAIAVLWAFGRFTAPWLGRRETELDMALLVERQEQIDSDLVAAVQFDSPGAAAWGSARLRQAVIEQAAQRGKRLDVMKGLSRKRLFRRLAMLLLSAAAWAAVGYGLTDHLSAFARRMFLLSSVHYPTRTRIASIVVKSRPAAEDQRDQKDPPAAPADWKAVKDGSVDPADPSLQPIRILYGHQVRFQAECSGELPETGKLELTARRSGSQKEIELRRDPQAAALYTAELEPLREEHRWQLYLGDAWTDPAVLTVSRLPLVDVQLEVTPPLYAVTDQQTPSPSTPAGLRQISVIEGSSVRVNVRTDSALKAATLTIVDRTDGNTRHPLGKVPPPQPGDPRELWVIDGQESPLSAVTELTRYQIDVTDVEGQQLEQPVTGVIRIRTDAPPRIAAAVVTRWVLPTARPTIYYRAVDDYGLGSVSIDATITRADGSTQQRQFPIFSYRPDRSSAGQGPPPRNLAPRPRSLAAGHTFDLGPLELNKDDTVKVTLRATDFRGRRPGKSAVAEELVFHVTDQQGILAGMMETDRQSAGQLKTMIQRQLGIGDSP